MKGEFQIRKVPVHDTEVMERVGKLRYEVWKDEGLLDLSQFSSESWGDEFDCFGQHWIAETVDGQIVGAARMHFFRELDESSRDVAVWIRCGHVIPLPTVDFGRLVVRSDFRRRGIAQMLNDVRMNAAREMGAKSIIVTASEANAKLLLKLGFFDINERVVFPERPGAVFICMQYNFI